MVFSSKCGCPRGSLQREGNTPGCLERRGWGRLDPQHEGPPLQRTGGKDPLGRVTGSPGVGCQCSRIKGSDTGTGPGRSDPTRARRRVRRARLLESSSPSGSSVGLWADSTPPRASAGCHLDFWGFKACRRPAGSALSATVLSGHTAERLPGPVHLLGSRRVTRGPEVALLDHLRNLLVGDGGPQRRLGAGVLCVLSAERQGHPG